MYSMSRMQRYIQMHLIPDSDIKSNLLFKVSGLDSDFHIHQTLIYFAINSEMSAFTARKHFFSITHNQKD